MPYNHRVYRKRYDSKTRAFINEMKSKPCADCGNVFHYCVMDFDHRPGTEKSFAIGAMHTASIAKVKAEMEKCDVVCSNCHRIRTFTRQYGPPVNAPIRRGGRAVEGTRLENEQTETSRGFESTPSPPVDRRPIFGHIRNLPVHGCTVGRADCFQFWGVSRFFWRGLKVASNDNAAVKSTDVAIISADEPYCEVKLADGAVLRVRTVFGAVRRVAGDEPNYALATQTITIVVKGPTKKS